MARSGVVRWVVVGVCAAAAVSWAAQAGAADYKVDAIHSSVLFRIKHMKTSYTWGRFNAISGTLSLEGDSGALAVSVEADSIDTGNTKRDQHLRGPDFFNVKQFPAISFEATKLTKTGDDKYAAEGTLTLHGTSRPITVELEQTGTNKNPLGQTITGLHTEFEVERSEFGMDFALDGASDSVLVIVSLECTKK